MSEFDPSSTSTYLPSLPTVVKSFVLTLQHVSKEAQDCWAKMLNACLSSITNNSADESLWTIHASQMCACIHLGLSAGHHLCWCKFYRKLNLVCVDGLLKI